MAGVATLAVAVQAVLSQRFRMPLWYDELWRPHFAAEPLATFWSELSVANTPSALGSLALLRLCGTVFGWHAWSLRLPSAVPLVALAVGTWLLARRLTGRTAALGAAVTVTVAGTMVDLASQVKPYTLDAACAVAVVGLWMDPVGPAGTTSTGRLARRRTLAGVLALFSIPALFLIVALTAQDAVRALRAGAGSGPRPGEPWAQTQTQTQAQARLRAAARAVTHAAARAAPAAVIAGAHALFFVTHQSSQRASTFWDDHFLAGRGPVDAARLLISQLAATAAGVPPGIDRYDPNLVHPLTDSSTALVVVLGSAVTIAFVAGVITLARRADGRVLLVAAGGAELMTAAASAWRYWPFGAVRPNTFLVPLLTVITAVGAAALATSASKAWRGRPRTAKPTVTGPTSTVSGRARARALIAGSTVVLVATAAVPVAAATGLGPLWEERTDRRPIDLMVDATLAARAEYRPGDLVLVGGRLARAGWLYGMEHSDDGTGAPVGPRVPTEATSFLTAIGDGGVGRALARRSPGPGGRVLLFVLAYDRRGTEGALAEARGRGWCPATTRDFDDFELTGTLRVLTGCPR